jgi:hypothetical protein
MFNCLVPSLFDLLTSCERNPHELCPSEFVAAAICRASLLYKRSHSYEKQYELFN